MLRTSALPLTPIAPDLLGDVEVGEVDVVVVVLALELALELTPELALELAPELALELALELELELELELAAAVVCLFRRFARGPSATSFFAQSSP